MHVQIERFKQIIFVWDNKAQVEKHVLVLRQRVMCKQTKSLRFWKVLKTKRCSDIRLIISKLCLNTLAFSRIAINADERVSFWKAGLLFSC